jgi:hypothetical protein
MITKFENLRIHFEAIKMLISLRFWYEFVSCLPYLYHRNVKVSMCVWGLAAAAGDALERMKWPRKSRLMAAKMPRLTTDQPH